MVRLPDRYDNTALAAIEGLKKREKPYADEACIAALAGADRPARLRSAWHLLVVCARSPKALSAGCALSRLAWAPGAVIGLDSYCPRSLTWSSSAAWTPTPEL